MGNAGETVSFGRHEISGLLWWDPFRSRSWSVTLGIAIGLPVWTLDGDLDAGFAVGPDVTATWWWDINKGISVSAAAPFVSGAPELVDERPWRVQPRLFVSLVARMR